MAVIPSLEISWQENYRRKTMPMGLRNLGNTCYLNSVLQCLTFTPPLANFCLRGHHSRQCDSNSSNVVCPFCILEKRIACSLSNDVPIDSPQRIYRCLQTFAKHFRPGRQEDAHELLRYAIDTCDNVCIRLHKRRLNGSCKQDEKGAPKEEVHTAMKEIFGGRLQSQIKCLSCNEVSSKLDTIMDLSLDIMNAKTLKEAICKFFQPEVLDGNNKYKCEKCKKLSVAKKQMSIFEAPNVLVIQLKRFENFLGGKIDRHIGFEEKISLTTHISENSKDLRPDYSLYGVVVHSGYTQYGGHYYAYVKDPRGKWHCCNDSQVSAADSRAVLSEKVYILFYVRDHARPRMFEEGPHSASSTPSPPATPDPTMLIKPPASSPRTLPSPKEGQPLLNKARPQLKFSISKPDKVAPKFNVKPKTCLESSISETQVSQTNEVEQAGSRTSVLETSPETSRSVNSPEQTITSSIKVDVEKRELIAPSLSSTVQDTKALSDVSGARPCLAEKRQREPSTEKIGTIHVSLQEFKNSADYENLKARLENEGREVLMQSGWCDDVRESFRAAKRCREINEQCANDPQFRNKLISDVREPLLRQMPVSVKEHLGMTNVAYHSGAWLKCQQGISRKAIRTSISIVGCARRKKKVLGCSWRFFYPGKSF